MNVDNSSKYLISLKATGNYNLHRQIIKPKTTRLQYHYLCESEIYQMPFYIMGNNMYSRTIDI